jgi:hypothetical protein
MKVPVTPNDIMAFQILSTPIPLLLLLLNIVSGWPQSCRLDQAQDFARHGRPSGGVSHFKAKILSCFYLAARKYSILEILNSVTCTRWCEP